MSSLIFFDRIREALVSLLPISFSFDDRVVVKAKPLKPEEAIGRPGVDDFPIIKGRERMMEAEVRGFRGQAFTDMFGDFDGAFSDVMNLTLSDNFERSVFISTVNAVSNIVFGPIGTVHCKDKEPFFCAQRLKGFVQNQGYKRVSLFGFQPRFTEVLSGVVELRVVDLDEDNIGKEKFGVVIEGPEATEDLLKWGEFIFVTGTCFTNNTFDPFLKTLKEKRVVFYGVTCSGICKIFSLERFCPLSRQG